MAQVMFVVQGYKDKEKRPDSTALEELVREEPDVMRYYCALRSTAAVICGMSSKAYSQYFKVGLQREPAKRGSEGYTVEGFKEVGEAAVPEKWKKIVETVHLLYSFSLFTNGKQDKS